MPPTRPATPRVGPFTPAELVRMAWAPSYRAPPVRAMHDPDAFPASPVRSADLTGRAFLSGHHDGSPVARLVAVQPYLAELASCPHLRSLRRLDLTGNRIGPAGVRELAGSPYLTDLRQLGLAGNDLGADGMAAVRAAPWFANLTAIDLAGNRLAATDLDGLPPRLASLDVSRNPLGPAGADAIRSDGRFDTLRASGCGLGPNGMSLLDAAERLDLSRNAIGSGAVVPSQPDHLRDLDLGFNDLGDAGVAAVVRLLPAGLRSLRLAGNRLAAVDGLPPVESLDVSANPLGDGGATGLDISGVRRLDLSNCGLSDAGGVRLVATGRLAGVRSLSLAWNRVGDAGAKALAGCPDLAGLDELDLTGTGIGFAGAIALADSKHLRLGRLTLGHNHGLPADGVRMLAERFGTIDDGPRSAGRGSVRPLIPDS